MDAFTDPEVEEIWFCKPTQVGGTESLLNMLGYVIAQDPSPAMIVYPTDKLAKYASENRIQMMLDLCPQLKAEFRLRESQDLELQFNSMYLVLSGANSPASLASYPIRILLLDEIDKFPRAAGREADPIKLARERTKTFRYNRKLVGCSTPTFKTGNIWKEINAANELLRYFVPCPHCGAYQELKFKQIKWPEGSDADAAHDLAYYECEGCKGRITDSHKPMMLRTGEWRCIEKRGTGRSSIGFHMNTIYSPWVSFGDVAKEFLDSKRDTSALQNFVNSWLAEPWEDKVFKVTAETVMSRQSEYPRGVVPREAMLLTAGVDVQRESLYWTVRAWGPMLTSWNIAHGNVLDWTELEQLMNQPWKNPEGEEYLVGLCAIDSGDQTEEVYDFCVSNMEWAVPVKGSSFPLAMRFRLSTIDRVRSRAHGMRLVIIDTAQYKSMIMSRLHRQIGAGCWMVYRECDTEYAEQIASEDRVREMRNGREVEVWKPKTTHADNHYLDAEVYAACAADLMQVRYLDEPTPKIDDKQPLAETSTRGDKQNGWLPNTGKWLK